MRSKWNKLRIGAFAVLTACAAPDEDFTIIVLPDTQFYTATMNGGSP